MRFIVRVAAASLALLVGAACAGSAAIERGSGVDPPRPLPGHRAPAFESAFDGSFEVGEPEYYTLDPRVR